MRVLLTEPDYPNKYPPLGLLKIATYHRDRGDDVTFVKGLLKGTHRHFDRIYVSTLFSFHHERTINTILHYKKLVDGNVRKIIVGGVYATLNPKGIFNETGIYPITGLLDRPGILGNDNVIVDTLIPAYDMINAAKYSYELKDAYFGYTTRGCPNRCSYCAVPILEPKFIEYRDIKPYVRAIRDKFGEKSHMVLMDNNVLASKRFREIVRDLKDLGFERGAKLNKRKRTVDFNQGIDAGRVNSETAALLAEICAEPVRLAYDTVNERKIFERAVRALDRVGLTDLSVYVLYNYDDSPADLYARLRHAVELNALLDTTIYSFPMRYTPIHARDRRHVGPKWTPKHIRGLQCILNVTKGLVSHRGDLFLEAFGDSPDEFEKIVLMPEKYILHRFEHRDNGARKWRRDFRLLKDGVREEFIRLISQNNKEMLRDAYPKTKSRPMKRLLEHYLATGGQNI